MSLRPRYSLLTLLILTALVAGGVKLWYGPHHVIEWPNVDEEIEYTYTRDWRGERIIDGPRIERWFEQSDLGIERKYGGISISYYRQGIQLPHSYLICHLPNFEADQADATDREAQFSKGFGQNNLFTPEEREAYHQAIRRERVKLKRKDKYHIAEFFDGGL